MNTMKVVHVKCLSLAPVEARDMCLLVFLAFVLLLASTATIHSCDLPGRIHPLRLLSTLPYDARK
jgi:hypothetical protein